MQTNLINHNIWDKPLKSRNYEQQKISLNLFEKDYHRPPQKKKFIADTQRKVGELVNI